MNLMFIGRFIRRHCTTSLAVLLTLNAAVWATGLPAKPLPWLAELGSPAEPAAVMEHLSQKAGDRSLVLLGESSHGTHEFYTERDKISRHLIENHGFSFIAVEGDWASLWQVNRYVKNKPGAQRSAREALLELQRWPTWMWANEEIVALVEWLREWNDQRPMAERVGFYGMDVYAPWDAADWIIDFAANYLNESEQRRVGQKLARFRRHPDDVQGYVQSYFQRRAETLVHLRALNRLLQSATQAPDYKIFAARQSTYVVMGAHQHFMGMATGGADSWNARVRHMQETVARLMEHYGEDSRGIVWAHNTHIGDARATSMVERGEINIGQLAREQWGPSEVFSVGFATYRGTVLAGREWGGPRQQMQIPPGIPGSLEAALQSHFPQGALLQLGPETAAAEAFDLIPHRAIGVIYHPEREQGNYVPTRPAARYDALIFIPETQSLRPLHQ